MGSQPATSLPVESARDRWYLNSQLLLFFAVSTIYVFAVFIIFLLFNLYLLDLGFKEDAIGFVTGAISVGGIVGTIPAGLLAQRVGLRRTMIGCFASVAVLSMLRVCFASLGMQLLLAVLAGAGMAIWGVCVPPAVAQLTNERTRPRAFSILFASGIGIGVISGLVGGRLPEVLRSFGRNSSPADLKRNAILFASLLVALAIVPALRLKSLGTWTRSTGGWHLSPFLIRFLCAMGIWSLVTGAFAPLASVYFAQRFHLTVSSIGLIFSGAQTSQVAAILLAPALLRACGVVKGIAATQIAAAATLLLLAATPYAGYAAVLYGCYTAAQWMCEPGLYSLLMQHVSEQDRNGASSLNALILSAGQALSAALAGICIRHMGYSVLLSFTGSLALLAGGSFYWLLGSKSLPRPPAVVEES